MLFSFPRHLRLLVPQGNLRTRRIGLWASLAIVAGCASPAPDVSDGYLFTYFTQNGASGLYLAASTDGYCWSKVERDGALLTPAIGDAKLMRDPSVAQGADGTYHMVWTTGWHENHIGYASTQDFITWSEQRMLPVMAHEPSVRNTWAPEISYDADNDRFLIFWASTIPDAFPETRASSEDELNHRIYYTETRDFDTFAPTEVFYDPGFSVIDATFMRFEDQLYFVIKDETRFPPKKYFQVTTADSYTGPFGELSAPISPEGLWVEGPSGIQIGDAAIIYYDAYIDRRYGALRSYDMEHWEDVSEQMHFPDEGTPERMRHGSIFPAPAELLTQLGYSGCPLAD
ncbi:glycoside hydrolase family protein [Marinimicrobium alkaliphilum]|uniref:glycosyl hydrolase n=1 Tax=Marinimicrobium alkaliphilum TaxID=2202654 RepID=UPI000DB94614|nr:glycosyl hydrolase [Marinimicrobium alkaliphilum]